VFQARAVTAVLLIDPRGATRKQLLQLETTLAEEAGKSVFSVREHGGAQREASRG